MAKHKANMELTPIMSLSILALFALAVPIFSISKANTQARNAQAAARLQAQEPTPSPFPEDIMPEAPVY